MKILALLLLLLTPNLLLASDASTFYLIRHTEKDLTTKTDPELTKTGQYRAEKWAEVFSMLKIDAIYSTDTKRTRDTAAPTAAAQDLEVQLYSPRDFDYPSFLKKHAGQNVVVVGHSNTTPQFANGLLGASQFAEMDESHYSRLYQVVVQGEQAHGQILLINPLAE